MKKLMTALLFGIISFVSCAQTPFDAFCDKFPLLSYPIISDPYEHSNFFYFQLDSETTITEIEFANYIRTTRWNEFQKPTDSLLHIYHYVPAGKINYGQYVVLFINCGYMPQPEKYNNGDIGAYENLMCIYKKDGKRIDYLIVSGSTCLSDDKNRKFSKTWENQMPLIDTRSTISANGKIIISMYKDNELIPYLVDTMYIDDYSGKILHRKK
ncbi:MAG: hypothetical protein IJP76_04515 [Paludibacteraceae bacterium]|nr:hypothetical protein [Paludibacteraceae bacterium]